MSREHQVDLQEQALIEATNEVLTEAIKGGGTDEQVQEFYAVLRQWLPAPQSSESLDTDSGR